MVQLQFEVEVQAPLEPVWKYFSKFQNITQWDPNTTGCQVIRKNVNEVGSVYNIVSVFNEKESIVSYQTTKFEQSPSRGYISLQGKNDMITAFDEIICRSKAPNLTLVKYRADISLRGFYWVFTPFIISGLNKITRVARDGCLKKCIQNWQKAKVIM